MPNCPTEKKQVKHVIKNKKKFYVSDETKAFHAHINVPKYNNRLYELNCI